MTVPLHFHTITELAPLIAAGRVSSEALTRACLQEIEAHDRALGAFITVLGASAIAQARELDAEIAAGACRGPLHGIPISLKDLIDQQGVPTTAASRVREGHVAAGDAPVTARLARCRRRAHRQDQPARVRVRHDERRFGVRRGPQSARPLALTRRVQRRLGRRHRHRHVGGVDRHRHRRVHPHPVGGLRHGRAQADVGRGAVRRRGAAQPVARSRRAAGPIGGGRVADLPRPARRGDRRPLAAACPAPCQGPAPRRAAALLPRRARRRGARALRRVSGVAPPCRAPRPWTSTSPTRRASRRCISTRRSRKRRRITRARWSRLPSGTRRTCGCASRWGATCSPRITSGRRPRERCSGREVDAALAGCDALVLPTLPIPAPPIGASTVDVAGTPQPVRSMMLRMTQLFNLTGHPAISLPMGETAAGLPCGLQLVGRLNDTEGLLAAAAACEPLVFE